jgi:hypothetical protein
MMFKLYTMPAILVKGGIHKKLWPHTHGNK